MLPDWDEVVHILTDGAHIASELVWEVTFLLLGMILSRWQAKRAARREHKKHHEERGNGTALRAALQPPYPDGTPYDPRRSRG